MKYMKYESPTIEILGDYELSTIQGEGVKVKLVILIIGVVLVVLTIVPAVGLHTKMR